MAIVGVGPKGLFALERLLDHARGAADSAAFEIDLFEPHAVPGAGPVYDTGQSRFLRMNLPAEQLNMWWPHGRSSSRRYGLSFEDWRARRGFGDSESYAPRAEVGHYLADGFDQLLRDAPDNASTRLHRESVVRVHRYGDWMLDSSDSDGRHTRRYDEVLIATGHGDLAAAGSDQAWTHAAPLVPAVFPVERRLARASVAPGATVAVRGFALTFIDAALALSEGRGGRFEALPHPYRLSYTPGAGQVRSILPFSRSGRPMLAKPDPRIAAETTGLEEIAETGRLHLSRLHSPCEVEQDLLPILTSTAASSLRLATEAGAPGERVERSSRSIFRTLVAGTRGMTSGMASDAAAELDESLAVGSGLRPPGGAWALGHTWRVLYPAIVEKLSHGGLVPSEWPAFHRLAGEMERLAFGPPPLNAAKLLALIEAGIVDLAYLRRGRLVTDDGVTMLSLGKRSRAVDVVLDAVLCAPGPQARPGGIVSGLLADGHVRIQSGTRGVEVRSDGSCVDATGAVSRGLALLGRASEDSVVGNDTLNRTLHPLADRWARRVVARAAHSGRHVHAALIAEPA
ncbi:MAG TPA: FAD/NAD(P)-binding protein [Solirubrobacteraceae bacterium]|nr:FAD/NAD(P)-binding protein [Solirubrobacteraceae bacterium]